MLYYRYQLLGNTNHLYLKSSPHPDSIAEPAELYQRLDFGMDPPEARLMDHNDLHVLDYGTYLQSSLC